MKIFHSLYVQLYVKIVLNNSLLPKFVPNLCYFIILHKFTLFILLVKSSFDFAKNLILRLCNIYCCFFTAVKMKCSFKVK